MAIFYKSFALLTSLVALQLKQATVINALELKDAYSTIDGYLVGHVETLWPKNNLDKAKEWLNSKPKSNHGADSTKRLSEALKQFTALDTIESKIRCNQKSYIILLNNHLATGNRAHKKWHQIDKPSRVETVINLVSTRHAKYCQFVYPMRFSAEHAKLNQKLVHRVKTFANEITGHQLHGSQDGLRSKLTSEPLSAVEFIYRIASVDAESTYNALKSVAQEEPDRNSILDEQERIRKDKIGDVFNRYLIEPCKYFVESVGPNIFTPAEYDRVYLDDKDYKVDDEDDAEFYLGLSHFRVCNILINHDHDSLLNDVIELASK